MTDENKIRRNVLRGIERAIRGSDGTPIDAAARIRQYMSRLSAPSKAMAMELVTLVTAQRGLEEIRRRGG